MTHPLVKDREILLWSCGTHSINALRNNLYMSQRDGTKNLRLYDINFGWKDVNTVYMRDEIRVTRGNGRRTDLTRVALCLDDFTLTNTTYTKQPFTSK